MLSDRFLDSSLAYQGGAGGLGIEAVRAINVFGLGGPCPTGPWCSLLDEGRTARSSATATSRDRIGGRSREYHHKVDAAFRLIAAEEPDRVRLIDASGSPDEVTRRLLDAIADLLP